MNSMRAGRACALFILVTSVPGTRPKSGYHYINAHYYIHVHDICLTFNSSRLLLNYARIIIQNFNIETPIPLKIHSNIFERLEMFPKDFSFTNPPSENYTNHGI